MQAFSRHGIPEELISDNGSQFSNKEFQTFLTGYGCSHVTSSPRHPQGNGLVERTVQTMKNLFKKSSMSGGDFHLALLSYRSTPHESTGTSPARLLMGRRLRTTLPTV
jgi:transposase InsO family protein